MSVSVDSHGISVGQPPAVGPWYYGCQLFPFLRCRATRQRRRLKLSKHSVIHLSGDSAIGFSGMEMETLVRYNFPAKIVVLNNGGIGPGMAEIPNNPMFNMKPNAPFTAPAMIG
jgi:hypothetical protein